MEHVFLKRAEVVARVGLCYSTIYNLEKAGRFPARRKLTAGRLGRVAWVSSEVQAWTDSRIQVFAPKGSK